MSHRHSERYVSDEERRDFLKALGVGGAVAVGSATLEEVGEALTEPATGELAAVGRTIQADVAAPIDAELLAGHQADLAAAATSIPAALEDGVPDPEPPAAFGSVAQAGRPIYDHLAGIGFFESTTRHLPRFTPEYLESAVGAFAGSAALAEPLAAFEFAGTAGVDLLAEVVANAEQLHDHHWVATDDVLRERVEYGEHIPPMTMAAAGGTLLWLDDLDGHLRRYDALLTDGIRADAVWHGQSMAAGFYLVADGARAIADGATSLSNDELGALLSTGFAVQAIAQGLLPQDVYWITEEMRAPDRPDLTVVTE